MQLGDNLNIPVPTSEGKRFAVVGKSGSGKTNSLLILARELMAAGWTLTVIDPMNVFRGLRSAGLPIIVAGARPSSDVQINVDNAPALAEFSFQKRMSTVLDVSMHEDGIAVLQAYLQPLWRQILTQHEDGPFTPYALLIDEAQLYIPQNGKTDISDIILDMGKRSRQLHLSMAIASQRPASIQKDFLTQSNVMVFHALRSVDITPLKDELGMPEKEARALMRRFGKGQAVVVGDPDMVTLYDEDYLITQIRAWDGKALMQPVAGVKPVQPINDKVLAALRKLMDKVAPKVEAKVTQSPTDTAEVKRLNDTIFTLQKDIDRLVSELATAKSVKSAPVLVPAVSNIPSNLSVDKMHVGQLVTSNHEFSSPVGNLPTKPITQPEWNERMETATKRAIDLQKRTFDTMIRDIRDMPALYRIVLVYLTQRETQTFEERQLVRYIGYAISSFTHNRPIDLIRLGFVKRTVNHGEYAYQSTARKKLATDFPDLDTDMLVNVICNLEKI